MADIRLRWLLDIVDRGGVRKLIGDDRSLRTSLGQTDRAWSKLASNATGAAERQRRASQRSADAAEKSAIAQGRAAVKVEEAQQRAARATEKFGAKSTQARTAALRLAEAERALAAATRSSAEAAASAASRQAAASSRMQRVAAESRRAATATARGAARGGTAAVGAAGGLASRTAGLAAVAGAGFGFAAATHDSVGFEKVMAGVQARLLTTRQNMERLSDFALKLGANTQFSAGQAAEAMDELAAQGFSVGEIFKTLPGTLSLAAASGTDLASSAQIQSAALRGFGLAADQAGRVADVLAQTANRSAVDMSDLGETLKYIAPVAKATGQSFESMLAAVGLMGNVGIKGSQAGTTLRTALVRLTNPTQKAEGGLHDLGIQAEKLRGPKGLLPLPDILAKIVKGAQKVDKGTRNAALASIFGREALSGMVALVEGGPKKFAKMQTALEHSSGAAQRAAKIMRNTVAGAWDNFTGSVETAAIKLTRRFLPAVKGALNAAAGGVNSAVKTVSRVAPQVAGGIGAGLRGEGVIGARITDPRGRTTGFEQATTAQRVGQKIGEVARTIGKAAAQAGRQLLAAFKPAMPFFRNILLPLLLGVGKGILGSVVAAFKVLIPIIRITATVLGAIGTVARPLRGVFEGLGTVIGFIAAGPILKALSGLGKIGIVFRVLAAPVRLVTGLFSGVARGLLRIPGVAARVGAAFGKIVTVVTFVPRKIAGFYGAMYSAAGRLVAGAVRGLGSLVGKLGGIAARAGKSVVERLLGFVSKIPGRLGNLVGNIAGAFGKLGSAIVRAIVSAIKAAPGAIVGAIKSLVPGGLRSVAKHIPGNPLGFRRGGRIRRFAEGGLVPILAAGGEMLVDGGRGEMIPGDPRRDSTLMYARPGSAVLTWDGQHRMAAGMSLSQALSTQMPHFAAGGRVRPLIGDAFGRGYRGEAILGDVLKGGLIEAHRHKSSRLGGGGGTMSRVKGPVGDAVRAMLSRARSIAGKHLPYTYGGGHGGFGAGSPGFDCSGYVSAVLGPNVLSSPMGVRYPMQNALARGAGKYVTVGIRGTSGQQAHTMIRLGTDYYESGGGHGPARVGGWDGQFDLFHPRGFRRGGRVPRMAGGGRVPRLLGTINSSTRSTKGNAQIRSALVALNALLSGATWGQLERIGATIRREVAQLERGKEDAKQKRQIQRLRSALSLVEYAAGVRVARITAKADKLATSLQRATSTQDRKLRFYGIDPSSSVGLKSQGDFLAQTQMPNLNAQAKDLQAALDKAKKHKDSKTAGEIKSKLDDVNDQIAETFTQMVENAREQLKAGAQEAVDSAQFNLESVNNALAGLDVSQRLNRTGDTPSGMVEKARALQDQLLPVLQANKDALQHQADVLGQTGDLPGQRQALLAVQSAGNDIASAMADAADLFRQAAEQAAQDVVDAATHGTSMAQLGEARLELEQRLAGTYDTGNQARADYIKNTLIPALNSELAALQTQQSTAAAQGDQKLADQIAESIAGKQNDILQAQLDAQEQIAENTNPRPFGGTLGFTNGNETLNDQLIAVGNGS